ncbi:hypothetical protein AB6E39_26000 [Vibrio splendidus]|uniref:hypothetical protein n=1 Tax=Vibrio splendidus TaxID=29497 RepID=UPI000D36CE6A|nr:hypothetical protein [Vibrio splendidus]MCC4791199.1 hypothetical protein [Vibrio splendidus]PTO79563.1 hypothetical protein CWN84_02255 [Vibrio splendidus]
MTDLTTISAALASIKTATDLARIIKDGDKSLEKAETKYQLAELIISLADAKIELAEVRELIVQKDIELSELRQVLEQKQNMEWDEPYYWLNIGENKQGPYCPSCYDNNGKLIRLMNKDYIGVWHCYTCKITVADECYSPERS